MAVASGAMYNARTVVQPFMSLNTYYGYVPPYRNENQFDTVLEQAEISESPVFDRCSYDTAMETDDDGCDYSVASSYLNNNSVILEPSAQNRLEANKKQQCQQQAVRCDADTFRRRNRKRCNGDLNPTSELKKFREGGGNTNVHCGAGSAKDHGLATVSYESELLHINTVNNTNLTQTTIINEGCSWAAGNRNHLNNSDYKNLLSSDGYKLIENNTEYEKILFETHGCSIYHLHRLQVFDDSIEAEF